MNLLDDYHSREHPCHLTSTVAPESPQPPGALGWVGQAYAKRKSVRLQEVPPNRLWSVQMGVLWEPERECMSQRSKRV